MLVSIGIAPIDSTTPFPMFYAPLHSKTIRGTLYGETLPTEDLPKLMEVMNTGLLKTDKLVTRLIKLEEIDKAMNAVLKREALGRWVIKFD